MKISADWDYDDTRAELFPDLHIDGRMTPTRAAELGVTYVEPVKTCSKCGSNDWRQYHNFTKGREFFNIRCHPCKIQEQHDNRDSYKARSAKRREAEKTATPRWLTKQQLADIKQFYITANRLTEATGIKHQVDHIIPIQNELVCGLRVPWNLQVVTAKSNASKWNRFDPDDDDQTGSKKLLEKWG
jgi:5-methylcytosine-specific restriction endonuclease McrA